MTIVVRCLWPLWTHCATEVQAGVIATKQVVAYGSDVDIAQCGASTWLIWTLGTQYRKVSCMTHGDVTTLHQMEQTMYAVPSRTVLLEPLLTDFQAIGVRSKSRCSIVDCCGGRDAG